MLTRSLTQPLTSPLARGVGEGGLRSIPGWLNANGVTPTIALDFANGRYFGNGATLANSLSVVRGTGSALDSTGATVNFAANTPRITDLGLWYDTAETATDIVGPLLAAMQQSEGTLLIDTGPPVSVNSGRILGIDSTGILFTRGASSGSLSATGGLNIATVSSLDTAVATAALRYGAAGMKLQSAASSSGSATTATLIGARTRVIVGRTAAAAPTGSGFIRGLYWFNRALTDAEMTLVVARAPSLRKFADWGDSMAAGTGSSVIGNSWLNLLYTSYNPDALAYNGGNGGDTSSQVLARFVADTDTDHLRWINLFWCGHNTPNATQTVSDLRAMIGALRGEAKYLIFQPCQNFNNAVGSAPYNEIIATRTAISAAFPADRIFDAPAALVAAAPTDPNVANGYTPSTLLYDAGVHLNDAGHAVIEAAVRTKLDALGWA